MCQYTERTARPFGPMSLAADPVAGRLVLNLVEKQAHQSPPVHHAMSVVTAESRTSLTSAPVQNMGHLLHGSSRAFWSHVLRYGLRTMRGRTGGLSVEAPTALARSAVRAKLKGRIARTIARSMINKGTTTTK
jgi:hypothetical protein